MAQRILLLDRDGTINRDTGAVLTPGDIDLLPHAVDGLRRFRDAGWMFFIVTNQGAIGEGRDTQQNYDACQARVLARLGEGGITIAASRYCPHARDAGCPCRKPAVGMWMSLQEEFPRLAASDCLMVGDKDSDVLFGKAIGAPTARISSGQYPQAVVADYTVAGLHALADLVL